MRYPALSLLVLPVAAPALAHPDASLHVHASDGVMWGAALIALAVVAAAIRGFSGR